MLDKIFYTYSRMRSLNYFSQSLLLYGLVEIIPGLKSPKLELTPKDIQKIDKKIKQLFKEDAQKIARGDYPLEVLLPEKPFHHFKRFTQIVSDSIFASRRRKLNKNKEFSKKSKERLEDLPEYYQRNFHFQTDGYLSEHSAELYEHQVEILFAGAGDAMRRLVITPMKRHFGNSDGTGLKFLEIGAGTGRATRFVRLAFPRAKIAVTDLSDPYLHIAQKRLSKYDKLDFMQADGTNLPFKNETFDAVYSIFLFHELPLDVREQVLAESKRVLKKDGFVGAVDSMQNHDEEDIESLLKDFPVNFHEPFYKNYIQNPLEDNFKNVGFETQPVSTGFLSKLVYGSY